MRPTPPCNQYGRSRPVTAADFSSNSRWFYAHDGQKTVIGSSAAGEQHFTIEKSSFPLFTPSGRRLCCRRTERGGSGLGIGKVREVLWDLESGTEVAALPEGKDSESELQRLRANVFDEQAGIAFSPADDINVFAANGFPHYLSAVTLGIKDGKSTNRFRGLVGTRRLSRLFHGWTSTGMNRQYAH